MARSPPFSKKSGSSMDNDGDDSDVNLTWSAFFLLVAIMVISKIYCCVFFTSMSFALNKTVDNDQRATLNGLASCGSSIFKRLGPLLAGVLAQLCFSSSFATYGFMLMFTCIGCLGLGTSLFLLRLEQALHAYLQSPTCDGF
jgi:cyanate permease